MTTVADVIGTPDAVMGAKAVFGPISSYVMCFGGRGSPDENRYYSVAAGAARKAVSAPWVFAIGGGRNVRPGFKGRVLNIVRLACVYGKTAAFVPASEADRLAQWPVAIALHDVWSVIGYPHLIEDLGLPDRRILAGSQDGIVRPEEHFIAFWHAVRDSQVEPSALPLWNDFYDDQQPRLVHRSLPRLKSSSLEGRAAYKLQLDRERDSGLGVAAKALNEQKYGRPTCEACKFAHTDTGMFDAHHPNPLSAGIRMTLKEHLIVLCPTCHRRAHRKDRLSPYSLEELQTWVESGRP